MGHHLIHGRGTKCILLRFFLFFLRCATFGGVGVRGNNRVYVIVPFLASIQWKIVRFIKVIK